LAQQFDVDPSQILLRREGCDVGRKHVSTLLRRVSIEALYRQPNTSRKHAAQKIWPYLPA
jgi:putative transposase